MRKNERKEEGRRAGKWKIGESWGWGMKGKEKYKKEEEMREGGGSKKRDGK